MSAEGLKQGFCKLLWISNGGSLDSRGRPTVAVRRQAAIFMQLVTDDDVEDTDRPTPNHLVEGESYHRGNCTKPWDCLECPLMQQELSNHRPELINWVCPDCLEEVFRRAEAMGVELTIPGHFSEGVCTYRGCTRPSRIEQQEGLPGLAGTEQDVELPRGYSRLRQLIIGPINM